MMQGLIGNMGPGAHGGMGGVAGLPLTPSTSMERELSLCFARNRQNMRAQNLSEMSFSGLIDIANGGITAGDLDLMAAAECVPAQTGDNSHGADNLPTATLVAT